MRTKINAPHMDASEFMVMKLERYATLLAAIRDEHEAVGPDGPGHALRWDYCEEPLCRLAREGK